MLLLLMDNVIQLNYPILIDIRITKFKRREMISSTIITRSYFDLFWNSCNSEMFVISIEFNTKLKRKVWRLKKFNQTNLETILACAKFSPTKLTVEIGLHREYFVTAARLSRKVLKPLSPLHDPSVNKKMKIFEIENWNFDKPFSTVNLREFLVEK